MSHRDRAVAAAEGNVPDNDDSSNDKAAAAAAAADPPPHPPRHQNHVDWNDDTNSSGKNHRRNEEKAEEHLLDDDDDEEPAVEEEEEEKDSPALALLLTELHAIARSGNYHPDEAVCRSKARNVLEATAGDVGTAAQLYWDDFLATRDLREWGVRPPLPPEEQWRLNQQPQHPHPQPQQQQQPNNPRVQWKWRRENRSRRNNADEEPERYNNADAMALDHAPPAAAAAAAAAALEEEEWQWAARDPEENNNNNEEVPMAIAAGRNYSDEEDEDEAYGIPLARPPQENNHENDGAALVLPVAAVAGAGAVALNNERAELPVVAGNNPNNDTANLHNKKNNKVVSFASIHPRLHPTAKARKRSINNNKEHTSLRRRRLRLPPANDLLRDQQPEPHEEQDPVLNLYEIPENNNGGAMDDANNNNNYAIVLEAGVRLVGVGNDSVSISDDEIVSRDRRRLLFLARWKKEDDNATKKRRKILGISSSVDDDDDDALDRMDSNGYLSDNDWLWDSLTVRERFPLSPPTELLWGGCGGDNNSASASVSSKETERSVPPKGGEATDGGGCVAQAPVVASDENDNDEEKKNVPEDVPIQGIPRTWLNAGFQVLTIKDNNNDTILSLAEAASANPKTIVVGLAVRPPSETDLAYNIWKSQQENDRRYAAVPPPYHCRAITALLSIVTGLLYTGAALQSDGEVSCLSSQTPLLERIAQDNETKDSSVNSKAKRKDKEPVTEMPPLSREFDTRLVDALTAILHIAARASIDRKHKALQAFKRSKDVADKRKWQDIQRKLRLVPTCSWANDSSGDAISPILADDGVTCRVQVATSLTNIADLRSYVVSHLRFFKNSGGCALLLETIIRIHGKGAVSRMIRLSRKKAGLGFDMAASLIRCTCDARHIARIDADPALSLKLKAEAKKRAVPATTTPKGHECLSVELLSLLLTGQVHSTLQGWSTRPLGIGILSANPGENGRGLTRPEQPVWILRGPTCYSVMWLNGSTDHAATFSNTDQPGTVASITHWNSWYDERSNTIFRLVTDRSEDPLSQNVTDDEVVIFEKEIAPLSRSLQMLARRRRQNQASMEECFRVESMCPERVVHKDEMDRLSANEEDQKFYPGKYWMWRYDMGEEPTNAVNDDRKQRAETWTPFYCLTKREKLVVQYKMGPTICPILWSRWPHATIDRFVPDDIPAIV